MKLFEVTNTTWENLQIRQRTNQCHSLRTLYWFVLCNLQIFSGCVCHLEQLHTQSPFLFPIVFSINLIPFFDICSVDLLPWPKNRYSRDIHEVDRQSDRVISSGIELRFDIDGKFARREFALQIEVDVARYPMIALRINLMNISAVTILLARVVLAVFQPGCLGMCYFTWAAARSQQLLFVVLAACLWCLTAGCHVKSPLLPQPPLKQKCAPQSRWEKAYMRKHTYK